MTDSPSPSIENYLISLNEELFLKQNPELYAFAPSKKPDFSSLPAKDLLVNLRDTILNLLAFKSSFNQVQDEELVSETSKLETFMEQYENNIRKHISNQYELRVILQDKKWALESLLSTEEDAKKTPQRLDERNQILNRIPKKFDEAKTKKEMEDKLSDLRKIIKSKTDKIESEKSIFEDLKKQFEEKQTELKILKREKRRISRASHSVNSDGKISHDELQPSPECSIFLSPLLEQSERRKDELKPRHKRMNTSPGVTEQSIINSEMFSFMPSPIIKRRLEDPNSESMRRGPFHKRATKQF